MDQDKSSPFGGNLSEEDVERIARAVDSDRNLSEFFINSVVYQVEKNLDRRTKLRAYYTRVSVVIIFAILAPSAWFGIKSLINVAVTDQLRQDNQYNMTVLKQRIDAAIDKSKKDLDSVSQKQFDSLNNKVDVETLHLSLIAGVIYLDVSQEYLREDVAILMKDFNKARNIPALLKKHDFPLIVDKSIAAFMNINYLTELSQLEDWFANIIANNPKTIDRLVVFYGEQLVGSVYEPARWSQDIATRFNRYLQLARGSNQYVSYLPIDILVEYRIAGEKASSTLDALIASIMQLTPEQQVDVLTTLIKYSDPSFWQKTPDSTGIRMANVVSSFLKTYQSSIMKIAQQPVVKDLLKNKFENKKTHAPLHEAMSQYYSQNATNGN